MSLRANAIRRTKFKRAAMLADTSAIASTPSRLTAEHALSQIRTSSDDAAFINSFWNCRTHEADATAAALRPLHGEKRETRFDNQQRGAYQIVALLGDTRSRGN
jgi:hypothetical protein